MPDKKKQRFSRDEIENVRKIQLAKISQVTGRNVLSYYSGWLQKRGPSLQFASIDDVDMNCFVAAIEGMNTTIGVDLILHTPGGSIAATEAITNFLRSMFHKGMRAIIPQLAMSGGTIIACACDEIIMGKHSSLGPTDPYVNGVSAYGILREFERAKKDILSDTKSALLWKPILEKYIPGLVGQCENAVRWAETIMKESLRNGMFRDDTDGDALSEKVVGALSYHGADFSHSQHLHIDKCREIGLKVTSLEDNPDLQSEVMFLHRAYMYTFGNLPNNPEVKLIENNLGKSYALTFNSS